MTAELVSLGFDIDKIEKAYNQSRTKTLESIKVILESPEVESPPCEISESISGMINQ